MAPTGGGPPTPPAEPGITVDVLATEENPEAIAVELPPVSGTHHYMPALDGLRALAVAGVVAYHFGFHWADGGYLGVDFFFVLSGFLITGLLIGEWNGRQTIGLRSFWFRRAKRLLPAVMLLLVVLSVYSRLGGPNIVESTFKGDGLATLFYYANWHLIFTHQSYFAQFEVPSTLRHTWSLAIEEQFYLVWPLLVLGGLRIGRRRPGHDRTRQAGTARRGLPDGRRPSGARWPWPRRRPVTWSCSTTAVRWANLSRVYYGTDTRAFELLIGAALALVVTGRPDHAPGTRRLLHVLAPLAAVVLGVLWVTAGDDTENPSTWMFRGGLVLAGLLAAAVIAGVAQPDAGGLGRAAVGPAAALGGRDLLRDLPLALAGLRADDRRDHRARRRRPADGPAGRHPRRGHGQLLPPRATVPAPPVEGVDLPRGHGGGGAGHRRRPPPQHGAGGRPRGRGPGGRRRRGRLTHRRPPSPAAADRPSRRPGPLASDPLRVMTIGDSVMYDGEAGIQAAMQATGDVVGEPARVPGWGLVNDTNFQSDLAGAVAEDHPEVILMMWSWDNAFAQAAPGHLQEAADRGHRRDAGPGRRRRRDRHHPVPEDRPQRRLHRPGPTPAGRRRRPRPTARPSTASSRPCPPQYPGRITYLPVASSLEVDGRYSPWLPTTDGGWVRARKTDNVHLCPAGAAVLGAAVTSELSPMFHLPPPAPGWIDGRWTKDQAQFGPTGECPERPAASGHRALNGDVTRPTERTERPDGPPPIGPPVPWRPWTRWPSQPVDRVRHRPGRRATRPCAACCGCPVDQAPIDESETHRIFSASIFLSALRCLLSYIVLPVVLPGHRGGHGAWGRPSASPSASWP